MPDLPEGSRDHKIKRKPVLPPRPPHGSQPRTTAVQVERKPLHDKTVNHGAAAADSRIQDSNISHESDPPPYDELDLQRAEAAFDRALAELDLNASVKDDDTATSSECGDSDAGNENEAGLEATSGATSHHGSVSTSDATTTAKLPSKWQAALASTRTFASSLVAPPVQSTRHYSILRHSHGLVAYRGLGTHVAMTLFADAPLSGPILVERSIWLQQRGWSGGRGMRVKTALSLGAGASFGIDVTPAARIDAEQVRSSDEAAWQRHIAAFLRKAVANPRFAMRRPVATYAVRIPVAAADGYFRLVVCVPGTGMMGGRKVLCASPVFRVASLSASASASLRGASLRTLPLEIGIKALSLAAAGAATQGAAPLALVIRNRFGAKVPGLLVKSVTKASGKVVGKMGPPSDMKFDGASVDTAEQQMFADEEVKVTIGSDEGPEAPYPVQFSGKVVHGTGKSNVESGLPTANLSGVSEWFRARMDGIYFGWVSISQSKTITSAEWRPALIFAQPPEGIRQVSPQTVLRIFIIEDFAGVDFFGAKLDVLLLGFIRSWEERTPESLQQQTAVDGLIAQQSLERPKWQPGMILEKHKDAVSLSDWSKFTRSVGRWSVDRVPFEKLAIRMPQIEVRDGLMGRGGFCIDRCGMPLSASAR